MENDDHPTNRAQADDQNTVVGARTDERVFGRYELLAELGRGGMGVVSLALDHELNTRVALKFLREEMTSEADALKELKGEVVTNLALAHPNIIKTNGFLTDGRSSAISMEYVNGTNLHNKKKERPDKFFEVEDIKPWILMLCDAMHYSHLQKVVHRDIKPANLMINERGELKVGDFGIGRTVADTVNRVTKNAAGTPPFMSPQQTMGEKAAPLDDIYSIGATIYDLLTGDPPFFRGAIREQALAKVPPSMTVRRKELGRVGKPIPPEWEKAVAACLAKEAAARPQTAKALRERLEGRLIDVATQPQDRKWVKPLVLAAAALAGVAGGFLYWQTTQLPPGVRQLVNAGEVTGPEGTLLKDALDNVFGDYEKNLATELVITHSIQPVDWKKYSKKTTPSDAIVSKIRPFLGPGSAAIRRGEEFDWLYAALTGGKGTTEREFARQLVEERTLTLDQWRKTTELYNKRGDPGNDELASLLRSGAISQEEAQWLREAIAAKKGPEEQGFAQNFLERKATVDQWRAQARRARPFVPPVDPILEKISPLLAARTITEAEGGWLRASLAGEKGDGEKTLATELIDLKSRSIGQWRAKTQLSYALGDTAAILPDQLPAAIDLPVSATSYVRLLLIPSGEYLRGSPISPKEVGRLSNESEPVQTKIGSPFYIGVNEVTQVQFESVIPKRSQSTWRFNIPYAKGGAEWPIDSVDWNMVNPASKTGFFAILNRSLAAQFGGSMVADLPTEEEWEYACRAGTQTAFNNGKPITSPATDKALDPLANYNRTNNGHPESVGSYEPNAWGLYDMHGNVSEWCSNRAIRGGSWQSNAAGCRAAWRAPISVEASASNQWGFRLVLRYKKSKE